MDVRANTAEAIESAIEADPSLVTRLVDVPNAPITEHVTMLWQASALGDEYLVYLLLRNPKTDPNFCRASDNVSCLYVAAQNGKVGCCQLLIDRGAEVNIRRNTLATPLFIATQNNHFEVVKLLIESGADLEAENDQRCTPFVLACNMGRTEIARELLRRGCNMFHRGTGMSPMMWCKVERRLETLEVVQAHILQALFPPKKSTEIIARAAFSQWRTWSRRKLIRRKEERDKLELEKLEARRRLLEGGPLPSMEELTRVDMPPPSIHRPTISLETLERRESFAVQQPPQQRRLNPPLPNEITLNSLCQISGASDKPEESVFKSAEKYYNTLQSPPKLTMPPNYSQYRDASKVYHTIATCSLLIGGTCGPGNTASFTNTLMTQNFEPL